MHGNKGIASLLFLAFLCLVISAPAQSAYQVSSQLPLDLKGQIQKMGSACRSLPAPLALKGSCGGSPATMKLYNKIFKGRLKGLSQLKTLYHQGMNLCGQLQPSHSDGPPVELVATATKTSSQLDCYWGRTGADHVELTVRVPNKGKMLPQGTCSRMPSAYGIVSCRPITGGVSATISYTPPSGAVLRIISTVTGYIELQRWASSTAAFGLHQSSDSKLFGSVAAALHLQH